MNYFNPYYFTYPATSSLTSVPAVASRAPSLFSRLFGSSGLSFSSILSGTSKTLNVVNQAIPLVKQASPIMKNAKTMFKIMNEFKKVDSPPTTSSNNVKETGNDLNQPIETNYSDNGPTFFL